MSLYTLTKRKLYKYFLLHLYIIENIKIYTDRHMLLYMDTYFSFLLYPESKIINITWEDKNLFNILF